MNTKGYILKALAKLLRLSYMEEIPNEEELESWKELVYNSREEYDEILKQTKEKKCLTNKEEEDHEKK